MDYSKWAAEYFIEAEKGQVKWVLETIVVLAIRQPFWAH